MMLIEVAEGCFVDFDKVVAVQIVQPSETSDSVRLVDGSFWHRVPGEVYVWFDNLRGDNRFKLVDPAAKYMNAWLDQYRR